MVERFLNPKVGFMSIKGIEKLIKEFPKWHNEYSKEILSNIYRHFLEFIASILPELPKELSENPLGIDNSHKGSRDRFANVLYKYGEEFKEDKWREAAKEFEISANIIEKITDGFCQNVLTIILNI